MRLLPKFTIGKILTSLEAFRALEKRYLIPDRPSRVESPKSLDHLIRVDRGGLMLDPKPGIYWGVYQLDFSSFFPSIIVKENVSSETVNAPCSRWKMAPSGHKVCHDLRGLVPEVLEELIELRKRCRDEEVRSALKWILVASFGYLGHRNARFGSIEAYETVTSYAREIARRVIRVIKRWGKLIHFMVDSAFFQGELNPVVREISSLGYDFKVEEYSWIFFPPGLDGTGVPGRYLGRTADGRVVAKGFLRKDMPPVVRDAMERSIKVLSGVEGPEDFTDAVELITAIFSEAWIKSPEWAERTFRLFNWLRKATSMKNKVQTRLSVDQLA